MKFFKTIGKNFKVLFRRRISLLAIILGPVLVLALIGIAFNSTSNIQLTVGYQAPDNSPLTTEFISTLESKDFSMKEYETETNCLKELKLGLIHTCIIFPKKFEITKDNVNNITFYVDKTRVNIAYKVIDSVSENIGIKSDELSKSLTDTLINTLSSTSGNIDDTLGIVIKVKKNLGTANSDAQTISGDLAGMDLNIDEGSLDVEADITKLAKYTENLAEDIKDARTEGYSLIEILKENYTIEDADLADLHSLLDDLNDTAASDYNKSATLTASLLADTLDQVEKIEEQFEEAKQLNENSREKITSLKTSLTGITSDIDRAKELLENIVTAINTIEITSSDQIVNPINTKIETISSENNQLVILFPYVLMLIIMFVGMMLSSTLVVVEKKSKASFRVFTTPTKDEFFIFTTFITAFIIVTLQTSIILGATSFFVANMIIANIGLNALIIGVTAAIFILIGMAIGYALPNQQGTNMASISIGAIFLFISNMVLPLESISPHLREIANYNPYVISSEILRKSILFHIQITDITREIIILSSYSILVVILIIIFQKASKSWYFKKNPQKTTTTKVSYSHEYLYFNQDKITTEKEFIQHIKNMSEKEYKKYRKKNHKDIAIFVGEKLNKKSIAKRVSRSTRTQVLEEFGEANIELMETLKPKSQQKENNKTHKK